MPEFAADQKALAFLAHWQQLRRDDALPRLQDFLDHASPAHAAEIFIFDVLPDALRVRLQGTRLVERWGKDLTGTTLHQHRPDAFRARIMANFTTLLSWPCGSYVIDQAATNHGRLSAAHVTALPLSDKTGRPALIATYSQEVETRYVAEVLGNEIWTHSARWIDIGSGLPPHEPNYPSDAKPPPPPRGSTLAEDILRRRD